jgi:hypothetical protein
MSFMQKALILQQLQSEMKNNREKMLSEQRELENIKGQNRFLEGVHGDYKKYHKQIAEGKGEYSKKLNQLVEYLEKQMLETGLSEKEMRQAKFEQKRILDNLDRIKLDINNLITQEEKIN